MVQLDTLLNGQPGQWTTNGQVTQNGHTFNVYHLSTDQTLQVMIDQQVIPGANHFFENRVDELIAEVGAYLDRRLDNPPKRPTPAKALKGPSAEA